MKASREQRDSVLRAAEYIEGHLDGDISLRNVAEAAGLSVYHFSRVFRAAVGDSVAEYVRKRRLTLAAGRLAQENAPVLDIALDAGYDSHEAFTRAFCKVFERRPMDVRRGGIPPQISVRRRPRLTPALLEHLTERISMEPEMRTKLRFAIVGITRNFDPREPGAMAKLPSVSAELRPRLGEITNRIDDRTLAFVGAFEAPERIFNYSACVEVEGLDRIPEGMVGRYIESQDYAVFTHRGPGSEIHKTVDYALGSWLPKSDFKLVEGAPSFELYDERWTGGAGECEFWVPVTT